LHSTKVGAIRRRIKNWSEASQARGDRRKDQG
jgi:hypothetical protein